MSTCGCRRSCRSTSCPTRASGSSCCARWTRPSTTSTCSGLQAELVDRYGKLPLPALTLLRVFRLKHALQGLSVLSVQWVEQDRIVVRHPAAYGCGPGSVDAQTAVHERLDVRSAEGEAGRPVARVREH